MDYKDTTIVLPTYNEGKNIGKLVGELIGSYPGINVLVVDDGSKDETQRIVKQMSRRNKGVRLFNRAAFGLERGLTNSAVDGIIKAKTKFAIVMDADFQHPIEKIGEIKKLLSAGNKLVVAVRTDVPGWELYRKVISKSLIYVGYLILVLRGKSRCSDIFSGYFGVERAFFQKIYNTNKESFIGEGYKVLFDLLKCIKNGSVNIGEVPYTFHVRIAGVSKATMKQGIALFKSFFS